MPKTRREMMLEEHYPDEAVETGFTFGVQPLDDPPSVLLQILGKRSGDGIRVFFEPDQYVQFVDMLMKLVPMEDAIAIFQSRIGPRATDDGEVH